MKKSNIIFLLIIIIMSALVLFVFNAASDGPAYASFSTGRHGTSLLYDTLQLMDYPVRVSHSPLTSATNTNHVYVIIQPFAPPINRARAEEILEWVQQGGRLIFLHNSMPSIIDIMIPERGRSFGYLFQYSVGAGEIITGQAFRVANYHLMNEPEVGQMLESVLSRWDSERIWFAEYYHGVHSGETFIGSLPLIVQLIMMQMLLFGIVAVWHVGKRFGKPVPYYNEIEREENEHVRAFARLFYKMRRK